jgi:DtxR family Mn-dependent transcriptional regulator
VAIEESFSARLLVRVPDSDPEMLRYLAEHRIAPGDRLEVTGRQPFGGPLFVRSCAPQLPLGGQLARAMRIELEESPS